MRYQFRTLLFRCARIALTGRAASLVNFAASSLCKIGIVSLFLLPTSGHAQRTDTYSRPALQKGSVATYSKEFAKRFFLHEPEAAMVLSAPLHALELQISPAPHMPEANQCLLNVYFDSRLPLHFPTEGPVGTADVDIALRHFFIHPDKGREHWLKLAIEDRRYFGSIGARFNRNAALATGDYEPPATRGGFLSVQYREFHRELFPGIAYLQINLGCPFPRWLGTLSPTQLWLKRQGGKDYTKTVHFYPQEFEKIELPRTFVERMSALEKSLRREPR